MATIPASVTIFDLASTGSLSTTAVFEAQFTSAGNATTVQVSLSQIGSTILTSFLTGSAGVPLVGNGTVLAPTFQVVGLVGGGIGTTTLTAFGVTYGRGTSTIGITAAGTAGLALVGNGSALAPSFQQVSLTAAVTGVLGVPFGGTNTSTLTAFGALYGNGTSTIGITAPGTTGLPLVGNGTALAPGFAVLSVPGGGTGTTTLIANRVLVGAGTSTIASTNVATTGFPLVGNGTAAVPGFALLTVVGGGLGTGTTTPYAVLVGGTTATSQVQSLATTAASGFVLTSNGSAALPTFQAPYGTIPPAFGGRLTLSTGIRVMLASYAAQGTVYYTPDQGGIISLYDGVNITPTVFTELSQATTDATKSPAAVAANKNYDMFVWSDSGTVRCTRGPAWSSDTSRGTGAGTTELTFLSGGLSLNANAITNGPAASRGTYVGTIRSNGSSLIDFIYGTAGSGGVAASFGVFNAYNPRKITTRSIDSGATYNYNVASTIRQARASAGNQVSFVRGSADDGVTASSSMRVSTAAGGTVECGLALDSTTTFDVTPGFAYNSAATAANSLTQVATYNPSIGWHYISRNERNDAGPLTNTYNTDALAFLSVELWQ